MGIPAMRVRYSQCLWKQRINTSHIQSLILTFLWKLIPDLLLDGFVYLALPPLYKVEWGKDNYKYLQDNTELEEFKKTHTHYTLGYCKGLGELSAEETEVTLINPKTRKIEQIIIEDEEEFDQWINSLMGKDSKPKHDFIFGETE